MDFLKRLLGRAEPPDPTSHWKPFRVEELRFDLDGMSFGALRFGDSLGKVESLGRPDRIAWRKEDPTLFYDRGGFLVEFGEGRLNYFAFLTGPDKGREGRAVVFSKVFVTGTAAGGIELSGRTRRNEIENAFGPALEADVDEEETVLTYRVGSVTMEFELDGRSGSLKRWNLFPG